MTEFVQERTGAMTQTGEVRTEERAGVGAGWIFFASIVMIVGGIFAFLEGLAALLNGGSFYAKVPNYPFGTNVTTWGWIVLIALASLSALANFFFIPFYPLWALTVITLDIFVIWALAAHGKALVEG